MKAYITLLFLITMIITSCKQKCPCDTNAEGIMSTTLNQNCTINMDACVKPDAVLSTGKDLFKNQFSVNGQNSIGSLVFEDIPLIDILKFKYIIDIPPYKNVGLNIIYGFDANIQDDSKKIFLIYQPVELRDPEQVAIGIDNYIRYDSINPSQKHYRYINNNWDPVPNNDVNSYKSAYYQTVKVKGPNDTEFRSLDEDKNDVKSIIFPLSELEQLIYDNFEDMGEGEKLSFDILEKLTATHINFNSCAEIIPNGGSNYKHVVIMSAKVDNQSSNRGVFSNAAANMGSLCPPNCTSVSYPAICN